MQKIEKTATAGFSYSWLKLIKLNLQNSKYALSDNFFDFFSFLFAILASKAKLEVSCEYFLCEERQDLNLLDRYSLIRNFLLYKTSLPSAASVGKLFLYNDGIETRGIFKANCTPIHQNRNSILIYYVNYVFFRWIIQ